MVIVVIPERFIPSVTSPVISHAKIKVSMVPIHLQDKDLAKCLFDIFIFLNNFIVNFKKCIPKTPNNQTLFLKYIYTNYRMDDLLVAFLQMDGNLLLHQ